MSWFQPTPPPTPSYPPQFLTQSGFQQFTQANLVCKIFYGDEIRRRNFPLNTDYTGIFNLACQTAGYDPQGCRLFYMDDEKDWISCDKQEEWQDALQLRIFHPRQYVKVKIVSGNQKELKPKPTVPPLKLPQSPVSIPQNPPSQVPQGPQVPQVVPRLNPPQPKASPQPVVNFVHENIGCDKCGKHPIKGKRYECLTKKDYDLCEGCFSQRKNFGMNTHKFAMHVDNSGPVEEIAAEAPLANTFTGYPQPPPQNLGSSFTKYFNENVASQSVTEKPKPKPVVSEKFKRKLVMLSEMGFNDEKANLELLKEHNGSVQQVVRAHLTASLSSRQ